MTSVQKILEGDQRVLVLAIILPAKSLNYQMA